jgi:hypothetical protein
LKEKFANSTDRELIAELESRGYVVRGTGEARYPLSAALESPFPAGVTSFEAWAIAELGRQITPAMVKFDVWPATPTRGTLHRGILRVF